MESQSSKRCPHYQLYAESLLVNGPPAYLAIRRCLLTERLIKLLRQSGEGSQLADKLVINATNGKAYAFVGPDLEAVTQRACTFNRCEKRCTPAYSQLLDRFGITDVREDDVTCDEEDEPEQPASPENCCQAGMS